MSFKNLFGEADEVTRRNFLGGMTRALLGVSAMPWLANAATLCDPTVGGTLGRGRARNVIYLYMSGGMSHLDTFDPKPGSDTQGPTEVIKTKADGVLVSQHFPNLAKVMDRVVVVNSMNSTQGAHAQGRYYMHTSYELRSTIKHPSLGAWLTKLDGCTNSDLPGHVAIGNSSYMASGGFFESEHAPLPIGDPTLGLAHSKRRGHVPETTQQRRLARLQQMNKAFSDRHGSARGEAYQDMYDQAVRLMGSKELEAFEISREPEEIRGAYGSNSFGQGCLLARRLIEHDVRFVEVVSNGWDSHNDNFDTMEERCPPVDQALASLLVDLDARGLLEETLVVLATEFGRTPDIKPGRNGRDHYPKAFSCLLAGGGVRGGQSYGKTDGEGREVIEKKVTVPDFNATIAHALGLPLEREVFSPSGRPFKVADKGKPLTELFA